MARGKFHGGVGLGLGLGGVVAEEIDGFADFGDGIGPGLAGFAGEEGEEFGAVEFEEIGGGAEEIGAGLHWCPGPRGGGGG